MGLTGLACEVNDLSRQQQEPPLIGNPRFLKRGGCQQCVQNSLTSLQRWMVWSLNATLESTQRFVEASIQDAQFAQFKDLPLVMTLNDKIIGMTRFTQMSDPFVPYYDIGFGYWIGQLPRPEGRGL